MRTSFPNDFNNWEIRGYDKTITIKTTFINDNERWDVSGEIDGTVRTVFSNNFEQWAFDLDMTGLEEDLQIAIIFVAIYTSFKDQH